MARLEAIRHTIGTPTHHQPPSHSSQPQPLTLQTMRLLLDEKFDEKLTPITTQMTAMEQSFNELSLNLNNKVSTLREDVAQEITGVKARMEEVERHLDAVMGGATQGPGKQAMGEDIWKKITNLEAQIAGFKHGTEQDKTAVIGGVGGPGGEKEARDWVDKIMGDLQCAPQRDMYFKGDSFKDLLFLNFVLKKIGTPQLLISRNICQSFMTTKFG